MKDEIGEMLAMCRLYSTRRSNFEQRHFLDGIVFRLRRWTKVLWRHIFIYPELDDLTLKKRKIVSAVNDLILRGEVGRE